MAHKNYFTDYTRPIILCQPLILPGTKKIHRRTKGLKWCYSLSLCELSLPYRRDFQRFFHQEYEIGPVSNDCRCLPAAPARERCSAVSTHVHFASVRLLFTPGTHFLVASVDAGACERIGYP